MNCITLFLLFLFLFSFFLKQKKVQVFSMMKVQQYLGSYDILQQFSGLYDTWQQFSGSYDISHNSFKLIFPILSLISMSILCKGEKKNNYRKVMCLSVCVYVCVCVCVFRFTKNLDTSLLINHPISAPGLMMCPFTKDIVIISVNRRM